MPPVTKAGGAQFRKDVEFAATKDSDEYELVADGIVMVPDKADLQNDFAREDTIQAFAEQFAAFEEAGQAGGGIMHAVWPDGWMQLERNEVLDEAEEIGGQTVEAGAWVQSWGVDEAELAALIDDGVLEGYSIGAIQVDWDGPFEPEEAEDVDTSEIPDGEMVWELTDGIIREVSAVDIPAVPDAQILEAKADADKRLAEHVGNQDAFIEEAQERGHTEAEAERLWDVLNDAMAADGSSEPGKQSMFARAGKAFLSALSGSDDDGGSEAPDRSAAKEGRTLSASNRRSAMAAVDANLDILQDAGVEHGMTRFTDQDSVDFDLTEHSARTWGGGHDDGEDEDDEDGEEEEETTDDAAGGDTPDEDGGQEAAADMTDDNDTNDPMADAPEWAKALDDRIDSLESEKDAGEETDDPLADAPEWAKALDERIDEVEEKASDADTEEKPEWAKNLEERVDTIVQQSGAGSQQVDRAAQTGEDDDDSGLKGLGAALS